jgi:hypothetical protein
VFSPFLEEDPRPGHEIANRASHENLARGRESADARSDVHGRSR